MFVVPTMCYSLLLCVPMFCLFAFICTNSPVQDLSFIDIVTADDIEESTTLPKTGYELTHPDSDEHIVEFTHPDLPHLALRWEPVQTIANY